jgi:hypothetical protein
MHVALLICMGHDFVSYFNLIYIYENHQDCNKRCEQSNFFYSSV